MEGLVFEEMKRHIQYGTADDIPYDYVILDSLRWNQMDDIQKILREKCPSGKNILNYYHHNLDKINNIQYSFLEEDGATIEYPYDIIKKVIPGVKSISEDETLISFSRFHMLRDKENKTGEKYITTFYEDYGYIPIGVDINKFELDGDNNFCYIPKDPRTFFIGNGASLINGEIDFENTKDSKIPNKYKISKYIDNIKELRKHIMSLPFDMRYFNSDYTKTEKLKEILTTFIRNKKNIKSDIVKFTQSKIILDEFKLAITEIDSIERLQLYNKIDLIIVKYNYLFEYISFFKDIISISITDEVKLNNIKKSIIFIIKCLNKNYTIEDIITDFTDFSEIDNYSITNKMDISGNIKPLSIIINELEKRSCITDQQYDLIKKELSNPNPNYINILNILKKNNIVQTTPSLKEQIDIESSFAARFAVHYSNHIFDFTNIIINGEKLVEKDFKEKCVFFYLNKSDPEHIVSIRDIVNNYMYLYNIFTELYDKIIINKTTVINEDEKKLLSFLYQFLFSHLHGNFGFNDDSDIPEFEYLYETTFPSLVRYKDLNFNFGRYETIGEPEMIQINEKINSKVIKQFNKHSLSLNLKDSAFPDHKCLKIKLKVSDEHNPTKSGGGDKDIKSIQQYGGAMITPSKLINSFNQLGMDFIVTPSKEYLKKMESIVISSASTLIGYVYKKFTDSVKSLLDIKVNGSIMYLFRDLKDDDEINSLLNRFRGEYSRYYRKGFKILYTQYKNYELLDDLYNKEHLSLYNDKFTKRFLEKYIDIYEYDKVLRYEKKDYHLKDLEHMKEFIMFLKVRIKKL